MITPIVIYGDPILRKVCKDIENGTPGLTTLIESMFETMYQAKGVGLAAPQIGKSVRLFIIDACPFAEREDDDEDDLLPAERVFLSSFKRVFINARLVKEEGELWSFNEGCLSIPKLRENVFRKSKITISYYDQNFKPVTEHLKGLAARVVQHEYDHIEGRLFTDRITPLRKKLIASKLKDISKGEFSADYKTKIYLK